MRAVKAANFDALYAQAKGHFDQGQLLIAKEVCEFILQRQPRHFRATHLLAAICADRGDRKNALSLFRQAVDIDPTCAAVHANIGRLLTADHQLSAAWESFSKALALDPSDAIAHNNLGNMYLQQLQLSQAIESYERALSLQDGYADARLNKAIALLLSGDLAAGWPLYEARWQRGRPTSPVRNFSQPLWLGAENLQGKTVLLHAEQGLGDTLQFCRYAPMVAALGAHVILEAPGALLGVLSTLPGVSQLIETGQSLPRFDYHCPLISLPLAFRTTLETIPNVTPYLHCDPRRRDLWTRRLGPAQHRRIGLIWRGSPVQTNDAQRSLSLAQMLALLPENCEYISLQKEIGPADLDTLQKTRKIRHVGADLQDFSDTAAVCDLVDVVISVDTSVAHLAGALGCPTWVLLAQVPDWRWMLERQDSPWYPTAKLFRQSADGKWNTPLQSIAQQLGFNQAPSQLTKWPEGTPSSGSLPSSAIAYSTDQQPSKWVELLNQAQEFILSRKFDTAQEICNFVLNQDPVQAEALHLLGVISTEHKNFEVAEDFFRRALAINPAHASASVNLGYVLNEVQAYKEAALHLQNVVSNHPSLAAAYINLGNSLFRMHKRQDALECFDKATAIKPDYTQAWFNRGVVLRELQLLPEAIASYEHAIRLQPDYVEAHWNKAMALLLSGDMSSGWQNYEWRWRRLDPSSLRTFTQPIWLGQQSLEGKKILLHAEQGLGDTLQFLRFVPLIADLGAHVILEVPATLMGIASSLSGVKQLVASGQPLPGFDVQCPLLSLPLALQIKLGSIPSPNHYLRSAPDKVQAWAKRLGPHQTPRIGLVWSGNAQHAQDQRRSLRLEALMAHLPKSFEYVSLQKDIRAVDAADLKRFQNLHHFGNQLEDFSDTAALCELMDVVVSVDTSVAHLAGALGRTTFVLVPYVPDWRWLLGRQDSPWYASMRLYRQISDSDWDTPLKAIAHELMSLVRYQDRKVKILKATTSPQHDH